MPIHGYPGNIITANPTAPTVTSASGVWTTEQQLAAVSAGNWPGYEYPISNSLRFNSADSAYLNRTPASAGSRTTWTWSGWVKRSALSNVEVIFGAQRTSGTDGSQIFFTSSNTIRYYAYNGSSYDFDYVTTQVFRDVSSWYHLVFVLDTTNATSTDRVRMYVNGSRVTAWGTSTAPSQNFSGYINQAIVHNIGKDNVSSTYYLNGYLTEVNFIDGQALEPSSFGLNDPETGVWSPKRYTGTYGTNGFYLPFTTEGQWSGYFDGTGDKLTSSTNAIAATGEFSVEAWVYQTARTVTSDQHIFSQYTSGATSGRWYLRFNGTTVAFTTGLGTSVSCATTVNTGTWYHVCVTRDSSNRVRVFLNGVLDGTAVISGSLDTAASVIGATQTANYWQGYISNVRAVSGEIPTAYQTSSTTVGASIFTPSTSQLTAVSGTSLLTCQSSTFVDNSGLGRIITAAGDSRPQQFSPFADSIDDRSGQGNHWIPNNLDLRTTGAGADILVDSPTAYGTDTGVGGEVRGNYCTWNPLAKGSNTTLSNGNLDVLGSTNSTGNNNFSTFIPSSEKWYFEVSPANTYSYSYVGVSLDGNLSTSSNFVGATASSVGIELGTGAVWRNNSNQGTGGTGVSAGETLMVAFEPSSGKVWAGRNGTWYNSGNPAAGTGQVATIPTVGAIGPAVSPYSSSGTLSFNFGQRAFAYTAPSGFKALCTTNLPTPTIGATSTTQANDYFDVLTYTGQDTNLNTNTIRALSFQPGMVWEKSRVTSYHHFITDEVRTAAKVLSSSQTAGESSWSDNAFYVSINSDGVTLKGNTAVCDAGDTHVLWTWKANGAGSSNTAGTITSTVSANTTSGFSIVTYTGNFTASQTVGHGLSTAPVFIITKRRDSTSDWGCIHPSLAATQIIRFNLTGAAETNDWFANTRPTSSVFYVGQNSNTNPSGGTMVAYCFAPVAGYSAFGSYTGNGSADGPFVYTGFKPNFVMVKQTNTSGNSWWMFDGVRSPTNAVYNRLAANLSDAEYSNSSTFDFLSNGFKLRFSDTAWNGSGSTYIYAAFAESPFKYSLAR